MYEEPYGEISINVYIETHPTNNEFKLTVTGMYLASLLNFCLFFLKKIIFYKKYNIKSWLKNNNLRRYWSFYTYAPLKVNISVTK